MTRFVPDDRMKCPECNADPINWDPIPFEGTPSTTNVELSIVVPMVCTECETHFEVVYEANEIGY